jgi:carboxypeptidase C (cathepsin A)
LFSIFANWSICGGESQEIWRPKHTPTSPANRWDVSVLRALLAALLIAVAAAAGLSAAKASAAENSPQKMPPVAPLIVTNVSAKPIAYADLPAARRFVTQHRTVIEGKTINYEATAGETYIANLAGEPIASIFAFSYVARGNDPSRPVMFIFNGGPGSSSLWLHMGAVGPRRLVLDREVNPTSVPPFGLRDNPFSVLNVADLVFIDPVGTGFSHAIGNAHDSDFYSVDADADSIARFIERWLTEHGRWNSPKYLMGESYGSVRAAILPRALMGGPFYGGTMRGITVDGVIMMGLVLDGPPEISREQLTLPTMADTAWYHGSVDRGGQTLLQWHQAARDFAMGDYAIALAALDAAKLTSVDKEQLAIRLQGFTGIPAAQWLTDGLRMSSGRFLKSLLGARGLEAGVYDSRYTLPLAGSLGDPVSDDPAMGRYVPGFVSAFHQLLHDDLKVDMPIPYSAITWVTLNFNWSNARIGNPPPPGYGAELAAAMRRNPRLRVMVASGLYDLATTATAGETQIEHARLPVDRVTQHTYASGHMLYLGDTAAQFASDVRRFIKAGSTPTSTKK